MWKLRRFLSGYKKELILGPAFKFLEAVLELTIPMITARIIDIGVKNRDVGFIIKMGFLMLLLGAVGFLSASLCQYYASVASQGSGTVLRRELFEKITRLSAARLDCFGTNRLTSALTGDTYALQHAVAMLIRLVIRSPFIAAGAIITAMIVDIRLSIIIFVAALLLTFVIYLIMSRTVPFYRQIRDSIDKVARITRENLTGTRVVRAFSKEEHERSRFRRAGDAHADITVGAARLSAMLNPLTYVIMNLGIAAVIWFGSFRINSGNLTQGELIALINYITQIMSATIVTAGLVVIFTRASASASRINEIFNSETTVSEPDVDMPPFNPDSPAIRFSNVTFGYGGKPALQDIELTVKRGSTVGIVGGTGAGKSTLARLILRFYEPDRGVIEINGTDVRRIPTSVLRKKIGYVPQRSQLLPDTIAENVRMGDMSVTDADIEFALRAAQADFVFESEEGIRRKTEQDGRSLSGGQRQRITIARALARKPEILIFDDCFFALDTETGRRLRNAIAEKYPNTTKIVLAQRVSAVKNADLIAVLEDGALVALGTHAGLLVSSPVYAEIAGTAPEADTEKDNP